MSDILNSAKQHDWYAHDETLAEELIGEIERLRSALETITIVPVGDGAAGSMRRIAVKALGE